MPIQKLQEFLDGHDIKCVVISHSVAYTAGDAILRRIKELRDEIDFLIRENEAYEVYSNHTITDRQMHVARMERLEQIKRELADIKSGKVL